MVHEKGIKMPKKIKKNKESSRPKAGNIRSKVIVEKTVTSERVDEIAVEVGIMTYGQCVVLKRAIDRRLASTRATRHR